MVEMKPLSNAAVCSVANDLVDVIVTTAHLPRRLAAPSKAVTLPPCAHVALAGPVSERSVGGVALAPKCK